EKLELEVVNANGAQVRPLKVKELMANRGPVAEQEGHLVVAIEMVFVGSLAQLHTLEELALDVRGASGGRKCRKPVKPRANSIFDSARLDLSGPANHRGHTEAAFGDSALGGPERSHASIRPSEDFCSVVRGKNDNGVFGLADILEMFQECADIVIQLR